MSDTTEPRTAAGRPWTPAWAALLDCSDETHGDSLAEEIAHHRDAIEAEARADDWPRIWRAFSLVFAFVPDAEEQRLVREHYEAEP